MQELISPYFVRVASLSGHVISFEANVARNVPEILVKDCLAAGCIHLSTIAALKAAAPVAKLTEAKPEAEKAPSGFAKPPEPTRERPADDEVEVELDIALLDLVNGADKSFLTNKNTPKSTVVSGVLGYTVVGKEVMASWARIAKERKG
jgi:hypothetical protein